MLVELKDVKVLALLNEQITMQSGDVRNKQTITLAVNGGGNRGVEVQQAEVWDESIEKLALIPNEMVTLKCDMRTRLTDKGSIFATLQAWGVERNTEGGQKPFGV